jgi:peptide deformylase
MSTLPADEAVLRAVAKKVKRIDDSILTLVEDMIDSMRAANGVGLAAPQIGVSLKVVVIEMPAASPFVMINPEIVKRSGARRITEGCLSVPGYLGEVIRSTRVTAKGMSLDGKEIRIRAEDDVLAQALEHEINHINGIVYIDQVVSPDRLWSREELEARARAADQANAETNAEDLSESDDE